MTKRGSDMSTKQLARTVIDGRKLKFMSTGAPDVEGYLAGQDDYHWLVVTSEAEQVLVHKGSTPQIALGDVSFENEPKHDELERVVGPYRGFVERELFGRNSNDNDASPQDGLGLGGA